MLCLEVRGEVANLQALRVPLRAGVVLLYLGSALLLTRLACEATMMYFERHMIYGTLFDRFPAAPP